MKKKLYIFMTVIALGASLCACGKKKSESGASNSELRDDIIEFVNEELPAVKSDRESAVATYNKYFDDSEVDLQAYLGELKDTAIPTYESYISSLEAIDVSTDEVKELKNLYILSAQKQLDAMKLVAEAIETQNADLLSEANASIEESKTALNDYNTKLRSLAQTNNIEIIGTVDVNTVSTSSDAE